MGITIRKMEDHDVQEVDKWFFEAWPEEAIMPMFYEGSGPESHAKFIASFQKTNREPGTIGLVAVSDETQEIAGLLLASIFRVEEARQKPRTFDHLQKGPDRDMLEAYRHARLDIAIDVFGELGPQMYVSVLVANPAYRRHGVGTLLLRWATDKADREGMMTFLESSAEAKRTGFYAKNAFEPVQEIVILDERRHKAQVPQTLHTTMCRPGIGRKAPPQRLEFRKILKD